jgi:hypothetical protein
MKSLKIFLALSLMFILSAAFTSCKKEAPDPAPATTSPPPNPTTASLDIILIHNTGDFVRTIVVDDSGQVVLSKSTYPVNSMDLCGEAFVSHAVPARTVLYTVRGVYSDSTTHDIGTFELNGSSPPTVAIQNITDISMPPDIYNLETGMMICPSGKLVIAY